MIVLVGLVVVRVTRFSVFRVVAAVEGKGVVQDGILGSQKVLAHDNRALNGCGYEDEGSGDCKENGGRTHYEVVISKILVVVLCRREGMKWRVEKLCECEIMNKKKD
ncbi:MAG: hypothetical protein BYD32DRAFT_417846, partial [Podila humilis]